MVAEFEQERGQVVGERTIVHTGGAERVPHRDVGEQSGRRHRERADREQGLEQAGLVEQRIGSLFEHQSLVPRAADGIAARQRERDEPKVRPSQATSDVGQDHAQAPSL